jgi:predicted ATPase
MGPVISISEPSNGATLTSSLIEVLGTTKNISSINLNDRQIFINESGAFEEKLLLSPGYNIITFRAEDRFGRKTQKVLELVYD